MPTYTAQRAGTPLIRDMIPGIHATFPGLLEIVSGSKPPRGADASALSPSTARSASITLFSGVHASRSFTVMTDRVSSVVLRRLQDAPDAGLSGATTPALRVALVETLTREAWTLAGLERPAYDRCDAPVSLRPLGVPPGRDRHPRR